MNKPPRSLDLPAQVSDDGSVIGVMTDSEQRDLHYDADGTGWQGRSIPNSSIGGSKLRTPLSSTEPRRTSTTKEGAVIGSHAAAAPPLFCARHRAAAAADGGFSDEGDDDEEAPPRIALALRAMYARHRHERTFMQLEKIVTELAGDLSSRRMIETTIALIKHEETEAARGRHADNKPTTPDFDDGARDGFAVGIATEHGMPRRVVRVTGARTGSTMVETGAEAAAAFASSLTDQVTAYESKHKRRERRCGRMAKKSALLFDDVSQIRRPQLPPQRNACVLFR